MIPWLVQRAAATPERAALVIDGRDVSFRSLMSGAHAAAARFRACGVGPGDVVATLLWNGRAFVECLNAVMLCGARLLPLNARASGPELCFLLDDASARLLVHGPAELSDAAQAATEHVHGIARIAVAAGPAASLAGSGASRVAAAAPSEPRDPQDDFAILYTSGTTGRPKGACLSLENLLANAAASALHLGASAADRWLACLPLFHVGGLSILVRSVLSGSAVIVHERFDAAAVSRAIDADGITHVSLVPTMLGRVLDARGERPAPETLRCVLLGGGPASPALLQRARAAGFPVAPTYGLTEASSQVATSAPGTESSVDGPVGRPLPGIEIRIEDEAGMALAPDRAGEICVRGRSVMRGYLGLPEETARALRGGWLHTGDIGVLDETGGLRVLDRRSDLVVCGGENVYPAEVEAVLGSHPDVAEAAVGGEPDADLGQRMLAVVVLRAGAGFDPDALRAFCRERLAGYKVPRRIDAVAELPRTASGKILRRSLASLAAGR